MEKNILRRRVAQMVMPRINGRELDDRAYRARIESLVKDGIGGFILFGGDIDSTPRRIEEFQTQAETPLLISSDVERGLGQQLAGGTHFPSQRAVASALAGRAAADEPLLSAMLDAVRSETRGAGIHIVFSPVMDVNNNPDNPIICTRAFGEDPETVEWFGARYISGLQKPRPDGALDLLACAKHFPGHGDTDQDSHSVLPEIKADRPRLNRVELPPFREAVKTGVGSVMIAHVLVPALDREKPVTFSKKVVTALLREGMEFDGLIVSDALDMGALANQYGQDEIAVRAVQAGMDILLHPVDAVTTINAVAAAVERGAIASQRIQESFDRIMSAKKRLGLLDARAGSKSPIDYDQHRAVAREIAGKAPRIVKGNANMLPLEASAGAACFVLDDDAKGEVEGVFFDALKRRFSPWSGTVVTADSAISTLQIKELLKPTASVIVGIYSRISASKGRSGISPELKRHALSIVKAAQSSGKKTVVVSFDSPYLLDQFGEADVLVAAYDRMDAIQEATVDLIISSWRGKTSDQ